MEEEEKKADEVKKPHKPFSFVKLFWWAGFLALVGGAGYYVWKNPNFVSDAKEYLLKDESRDQEFAKLQGEIAQLQADIKVLRSSVSRATGEVSNTVDNAMESLNDKFVAMEKINTSIIDSKADVAMLLGVIARMDKAEERLDGIAKVSDDSALILSTTMLIKEKALKGESYVFEAEVLGLLSEGKVKIKDDIALVASYAGGNVATNFDLVSDFENIYQKINAQKEVAPEEPGTWKERVKKKWDEMFVVRRKEESKPEVQDHLAVARINVLAGNFYKTILEVEKTNDPIFVKWVEKAKQRVELDKAFSRISTYCLALMQVKNLKANTNGE